MFDLNELRIPPLRLTARFTFEDHAEEMKQVDEELRPMFAKRMQMVFAFFAVLNAVLVPEELAWRGGRPTGFAALAAAVAGACGGVSLVGVLARRHYVRLGVLEGLSIVAVLFIEFLLCVGMSAQRARAVLGIAAPASPRLALSSAQQMLRALFVLTSVKVFLPMQPVGFGFLALSTLVMLSLAMRLDERALSSSDVTDFALFVLCAVVLAFGRVYVVLSRRGQWHFKNAVSRALDELGATERSRRRLEAQEIASRTTLLTESAAKVARARLIRMARAASALRSG